MYPTMFLLFPIFLVSPPISNFHPSPIPVSYRQNYVQGYQQDVKISFPGLSSSSAVNEVKNGDLCFTYDGRSGACHSLQQCSTYTQYFSNRAEKITRCGSSSRGQASILICCPAHGQLVSTTPSPAEPNLEKVNPSTVTTTVPTPTSTVATVTPHPTISDVDFSSESGQKTCGVFNSSQQSSWPWTVSIGYKNETKVHMSCLGTLITTEYILTLASCLQEGPPTIVIVGQPFIGDKSADELKAPALMHTITEHIQHDKFAYPSMYKNMGLIRLSEKVKVSSNVLPACFPFLAGVLDIINFAGTSAFTLAARLSEMQEPGQIQDFEITQYKILKNDVCSKVATKNPSSSLGRMFPNGIKSEIMCGLSKETEDSHLCPVRGAPLMVFDTPSDSYVLIGIAVGDPACSDLRWKVTAYTRINSFSSWIRDHVDEFPTPPPCYV